MKSRRMPRAVLAATAVAALAAGCSSTSHSPSGSQTQGSSVVEGGTLRFGSSSSIDSLNPFVAINQDAYSTFEYIYPELVQYNASMKFAPDFAKTWSTSKDGKVWTFKTQPNAK